MPRKVKAGKEKATRLQQLAQNNPPPQLAGYHPIHQPIYRYNQNVEILNTAFDIGDKSTHLPNSSFIFVALSMQHYYPAKDEEDIGVIGVSVLDPRDLLSEHPQNAIKTRNVKFFPAEETIAGRYKRRENVHGMQKNHKFLFGESEHMQPNAIRAFFDELFYRKNGDQVVIVGNKTDRKAFVAQLMRFGVDLLAYASFSGFINTEWLCVRTQFQPASTILRSHLEFATFLTTVGVPFAFIKVPGNRAYFTMAAVLILATQTRTYDHESDIAKLDVLRKVALAPVDFDKETLDEKRVDAEKKAELQARNLYWTKWVKAHAEEKAELESWELVDEEEEREDPLGMLISTLSI